MDPLSGAAVGGAKGAGSVVGKQVVNLLKKATHRARVSRAVAKKAKAAGIEIRPKELRQWLAMKTVQARFETGDDSSRRSAVDDLQVLLGGATRQANAGAVLYEMILDESLRRLPEGDARVESVRRTEQAVLASENRLLAARGDTDAFADALAKLHPWRRDRAAHLAAEWTGLRPLVITIAGEKDRRTLLAQWAEHPPAGLVGAPSEIWCWLSTVAADYGAVDAALSLIEGAVERGAAASYWWARAGVVAGTHDDRSADAAEYLSRSQPPHPLATAFMAMQAEDYSTAEQTLTTWLPEDPNDQSIKAILQQAAAAGQDELNRAISIGIDAIRDQPDASGIALRTAEALMSRAYLGKTAHRLEDFASAYELAIVARDSRRAWRGDSVAAILVAVKAAALASDVELAWQLTQPPPEGAALPDEHKDPRLQRESAILAANMGKLEVARKVAAGLADEFVQRTVEGWAAFLDDDPEAAEAAWTVAWELAPDDTARLQTAAVLAPLGRGLPDLGQLPDEYSDAIERIRTVHEVMCASGDKVTLLRARASESEQLTVQLAELLAARGDHAGAGDVLEAGSTRWSHPLLARMAAARYMAAGDYPKAESAAQTALSLGGARWAGRLETLMIQFEAYEAQGVFDRSLAVARELVALAPENLTVRWALVHCLVRSGDGSGAWSALCHQGTPSPPRDAGEARTWIGLAATYDDSSQFVQRSLDMMARWTDDPDVVGIVLAQIYSGLSRRERDVAQADVDELHRATEEYVRDHPDSRVFRSIRIDESDPLASITDELRRTAEPPELRELRAKVAGGELPLGLLADAVRRSYVEVCIRRGAGVVYSHSPAAADAGAAAVSATQGQVVVVDSTAAVTLGLLSTAVVDQAWGFFSTIVTTDRLFRDALSAQQSLGLRSTMTIGWNSEEDRPSVSEVSEEAADELARHADRTVELLMKATRKGWPALKRFDELEDCDWLSALDYALVNGLPLWCDDVVLRHLAQQEGVTTFGTVDVIRALEAAGVIAHELASASRAILIDNFHVDLPFNLHEMELAGDMSAWEPRGAAIAVTRAPIWANPAEVIRFVGRAIARIAATSPTAIQGWVWAAATGLIRIAGDDLDGAANNLRLFLTHLITQDWLTPDVLPFVIKGLRDARGDLAITDPFRPVVETTYRLVEARHGAPAAAEFVLMMVASLESADKSIAANVILTSR